MKCPKCGFTSFDFLENCKKCGQDLQGHKTKFGLRSLIFPKIGGGQAAAEEISEPAAATAAAAGESTDFGFDFMGEETEATATETDAAAAAPRADEVEEDDFSFTAEEEAADDFDFAAEGDDAFEFAEAEEDDAEDDFDFGEEETAVVDGDDDDAEENDEFAFADSDDESDDAADADGLGLDDDLDLGDELDLDEDEGADFGDWDEPDEDDKKKTAAEKEDPSDPFDLRESAELERAPGDTLPEFDADFPEELRSSAFIAGQDEIEAETEPLLDDETPVEAFTATANESPRQSLFGFQDDAGQEETSSGFEPTDIFAPLETPAEQIAAGTLPAMIPRLAAGACDLLILCVVFLLFLMAGELTLAETGSNGLLPTTQTLLELSGPYFLVFFALCFGYFTLFHFLTGQTPGKMFFGLRVEDLAGAPLSFSQAFLRSVGGLFSLLPAGLGFLAILFSSSRRGWNDLLAGSRLVLISEPGDDHFEDVKSEY